LRPFAFGLLGYAMFGLGCISYMTFIVTLLREQGPGSGAATAFYALLGALQRPVPRPPVAGRTGPG
jgi:hypothetical protein